MKKKILKKKKSIKNAIIKNKKNKMMKNKQKDSLRRFKECEYIVLKVKREEGVSRG